MAKNYYSDEDYFQAEYVIYNDLSVSNIKSLSQDDFVIDEKKISGLLEDGEEWSIIPNTANYLCTNYGRVINFRNLKQIKAFITSQSVNMFLHSQKFHFKEFFKEQGWKYNFGTIENNYKKYGWRHTTIKSKRSSLQEE